MKMILGTDSTKPGQVRILFGVNADIVSWIGSGRSMMLKGLLETSGVSQEDIASALGLLDPLEKRRACIEIVRKLWESFPEFGPYPLLDFLDELEKERAFYPQYRDHAAHQFMVFILGFYILENCHFLKALLLAETGLGVAEAEPELLRRWALASLAHDCGYVFECDEVLLPEGAEKYNLLFKTIERTGQNPLCYLNRATARKPTPEELEVLTESLVNNGYFSVESIRSIDELWSVKAGSPWNDLNDITYKVRIADPNKTVDPIDKLLRFFLNASFGYRDGYYDHGLTGAALSLWLWRRHRKYVLGLTSESPWPVLVSEAWLQAARDGLAAMDARGTAVVAAQAIAIHNINKNVYAESSEPVQKRCRNALAAEHLSLGGFQISAQGTPLAFLLCLADTLQDWDRPHFRPPDAKNRREELTANSLSLTPSDDGRLALFFGKDAELPKEGFTADAYTNSAYNAMYVRLIDYLKKEDVDRVIVRGQGKGPAILDIHNVLAYIQQTDPPENAGARGAAPPFSREDAAKIRLLTGKNVDETGIRFCHQLPEDGLAPGDVRTRRQCRVQWKSLVFCAEMQRGAHARRDLVAILRALHELEDRLAVLLPALDRSTLDRSDAASQTRAGHIRVVLTSLDLLAQTVRKLERPQPPETELRRLAAIVNARLSEGSGTSLEQALVAVKSSLTAAYEGAAEKEGAKKELSVRVTEAHARLAAVVAALSLHLDSLDMDLQELKSHFVGFETTSVPTRLNDACASLRQASIKGQMRVWTEEELA